MRANRNGRVLSSLSRLQNLEHHSGIALFWWQTMAFLLNIPSRVERETKMVDMFLSPAKQRGRSSFAGLFNGSSNLPIRSESYVGAQNVATKFPKSSDVIGTSSRACNAGEVPDPQEREFAWFAHRYNREWLFTRTRKQACSL